MKTMQLQHGGDLVTEPARHASHRVESSPTKSPCPHAGQAPATRSPHGIRSYRSPSKPAQVVGNASPVSRICHTEHNRNAPSALASEWRWSVDDSHYDPKDPYFADDQKPAPTSGDAVVYKGNAVASHPAGPDVCEKQMACLQHASGFTPINAQATTTSEHVGLATAKRLPQEAIARVGIVNAKRLSQQAIETASQSTSQDAQPLVAHEDGVLDISKLAERCTSVPILDASGNKSEPSGKKAKQMKPNSAPSSTKQDSVKATKYARKTGTGVLRYPHGVSDKSTASPGFVFRRVSDDVAKGRKGKPRREASETLPVAQLPSEPPANAIENAKIFGTDPEGPLLDSRSGATAEGCRSITDKRVDTDTTAGDDHALTSGEPQTIPTGPTIPDHQNSLAYLISTEEDFSTQAAVLLARRGMQEHLISPVKDSNFFATSDATPDGPGSTELRRPGASGAITPFRTFNSPPGESGLEQPETQVQISTQALVDAAEDLAFSTVKKPKQERKKKASFAPSLTGCGPDNSGTESPEISGFLDASTPMVERSGIPDNKTVSGGSRKSNRLSNGKALLSALSAQKAYAPKAEPPMSSPATSSQLQRAKNTSSFLTLSGSQRQEDASLSCQEGQAKRLLDDIDINAALEDAGSFLQSWDLEAEMAVMKKNAGNTVSSSAERRMVEAG
ncbi:hypothetical protein LTS18_006319 [Coniosporium uncinatum]|uniref:Uncharacterized protein n=1 Tax=Coniosporium uncinatum TaxID=93489 RepID=A0ACC3DQN1_9PEZI|nr:hypothetical protein LTS18_006319 [Coniosporium uncinatum]